MCNAIVPTEDTLSERIFHSTIQSLELFGIYLGKRLGLYKVLEKSGAMTPGDLARAAGLHERYAREWLEQQAVAGFLVVEQQHADAAMRRYVLPTEHMGVLAKDDDPAHVAPFAQMIVGIAAALPEVVDAYRNGNGVNYEKYGVDFRQGQGAINRPAFRQDLVEDWIPAIPDLHEYLTSTDGARIADVGCGEGWSTMALASAYPKAQVVGYDLDRASIVAADEHAASQGTTAAFYQRDAADMAADGPFDLILILESLHDMSQPTKALSALRSALTPQGSVVVVDERVAETFTAPGDDVERMMYGWSISHCLPVAMSDSPSEAIGTAIRPETVRNCAVTAGFTNVEFLPIENELFRFYRLRA
jgi:ubiquinone/menaquinone biosynthesis C-methylase UbiE